MSKRLLIVCAVLSIVDRDDARWQPTQPRPQQHPPLRLIGSRVWRPARGAPSAPTVRCMFPNRRAARSGASMRTSGARTPFANCLPPWVIPLGGAMDVAFIGNTLYALVSIVNDPFFDDNSIPFDDASHNGIYRVDGPGSCSLVADIGAFALAHPPDADIFLLAGVQYAMEPYRGGFLVTDGHHNRVYRVTLAGRSAS